MTAHRPRLPLGLDPLIDEVKQRMRRRRLLIALLAGVLALALGLTFAVHPFRSDAVAGPGSWVPRGVQEVDIHGFRQTSPTRIRLTPVSFRVTDPTQVDRIVAWFDGLAKEPRTVKVRGVTLGCIGGPAENVSFTLRGENGSALAKASGAPGVAEYCNPIQFTAGTRPANFLIDPNRASSLMGRVQGLLGVSFVSDVYLG
jgi:hypothetical protein